MCSRRAENMFWDYFLSWIARGIQDLHFDTTPRLPMIQAMFLSRMVLSIANHEKGIEGICCKILLAHPAPRLNHIPELKSLLTTLYVLMDISWRQHQIFTVRLYFIVMKSNLETNHFSYDGVLQ